jgi:hypothetical protein
MHSTAKRNDLVIHLRIAFQILILELSLLSQWLGSNSRS